jgi:hypothetical protein
MNAKLCKKLRQIAIDQTKGKVNTAYTRDRATNAVVLKPNCTRYVYHQLKKAV